MSNSAMQLSFNLDAWSANSPGLLTVGEWEAWSNSIKWPSDTSINTNAIPAMMRRRMSTVSKLAVQTAIELLSCHKVDYLVFSSRHGELHRSAALIEGILKGEDASPLAFSQSVHNTAAGLATIAKKQAIPLTSIAASDNTFHSALLEACLYLSSYPDTKVLLVDFDEPLPEVYHLYEVQEYRAYGLGLLLSAGRGFSLNQLEKQSVESYKLPQGLQFMRHFLSPRTSWHISSGQHTWAWTQA